MSTFVGDILFAGLALAAFGFIGYLAGLAVRDRRARTRYYRHKQRHRLQRHFCGFD